MHLDWLVRCFNVHCISSHELNVSFFSMSKYKLPVHLHVSSSLVSCSLGLRLEAGHGELHIMVFDVCLKNFVDVVGGFICDQVDWALSKGSGLAANIVFNLIVVALSLIHI